MKLKHWLKDFLVEAACTPDQKNCILVLTRVNYNVYIQPLYFCRNVTFLGSSVAEQSAVNRSVVGSNPTRGARPIKDANINSVRIFYFRTYY